jgi:nucleoside-diphosphate-sugar epimerase
LSARVAIVGAGGQIGTALCAAWVGSGRVRPVAIVRNRLSEAALRRRFGSKLEIRLGIVARDPGELLKGCDAAVNCTYASAGGLRRARRDNLDLIEALTSPHSPSRLVHLSSVAVYGFDPGALPSAEAPRPTNSYGREKLMHEAHAAACAARIGKDLFVLRVGHVVGAYQQMSCGILEELFDRRALTPPVGAGSSNCVSVSALVRGVERAALGEVSPGNYDLTDSPNRSWREVYEWHAAVAGLPNPSAMRPEDWAAACAVRGGGVATDLRALAGAVASQAAGVLSASLSTRLILDALIAGAPFDFEDSARGWHIRAAVSRQTARASAPSVPMHFLQRNAPGRSILSAPLEPTREESSSLREWWTRLSVPMTHV